MTDLDEWRSALADLSETERVQICGHIWQRGECAECKEVADV